MLNTHRKSAVAGQFYSSDSSLLQSDIDQYLSNTSSSNTETLKAIIVPHAGYIYSGAVAASAYKLLCTQASTISKVVLLGPAHRVAFNGIATPSAHFFDTPLGPVTVNRAIIDKVNDLDFVHEFDDAHQNEHSLEVQLPFLQTVLDDFSLIPLLVGNCDENQVASVLELLWGGKETLIVISSDLSHFEDYDTANKMDNETSQAILNLQTENIQFTDACGRTPVNGLLKIAKQKELSATIIDVRNSGDTAGDKSRVVGYGAYSFR